MSLDHHFRKRRRVTTSSTKGSALKARKAREAQIIADLLDTPSKRYSSSRSRPGTRRQQARFVLDTDSDLSDLEESSDEDKEEESSDEEGRNAYLSSGLSSASSSASESGDDERTKAAFSEDDFDDSSDEDTAITSDEDYESEASVMEDPIKRRRQTVDTPNTPSKRRRLDGSTTSTPRAKDRILDNVTSAPHLPARSLNMTTLTLADLEGLSPQARAKKLLHVGATPERLPCREDQYEEVLACVEDAVQDGIGGCVYVSGVPGVGKTATVREAIRSLKHRAQSGLINPFKFVEINGMKLTDAQDAYSLLWQTLTGLRCSNRMALRCLSEHFAARANNKAVMPQYGADTSSSSSSSTSTVVLMDELDQLVTTRQEVMYNMFNWPNSKDSRLIVIAVANTMDLPERILNPKVSSRLGMTRITFKPYTDKQLVAIVHSRLGIGLSEGQVAKRTEVERELIKDCQSVFLDDAIVYIAKRVSNVSGDARRMLDLCRRAIDAVEMQTEVGDTSRQVSMKDVMKVVDSMVKSGKGSHVSKLPLQTKIALISILACSRRSGVAEVDLAAILAHQRSLCRMQAISATLHLQSIAPIMAQLCSLGLLIAVGSGTGTARGGMHARFLLGCQEDEIRLALEGDEDRRIRSML